MGKQTIDFLGFFRCIDRIRPYLIEVITISCGGPHYFEVVGGSVLGYPLKTLLTAIEKRHGHEAVVETLKEAGLPVDRIYRLDVPYPESEAQRLTVAASQRLSLEDIAQAFFEDTIV